jgi:hypothetical protein
MTEDKETVPEKPVYKRVWFWIAAIVIVSIAIAGADDEKERKQAQDNTEVTAPAAESKPEPEPEPAPQWPDVELSRETVATALSDVKGGRSVKVTEDTLRSVEFVKDSVQLRINLGTAWNEKDYARKMADSIVRYSEVLFEHPDVGSVILTGYTEFTDEYGNAKDDVAIYIEWSRATSDKIDYDNLTDIVALDYTRAFAIADGYKIHAGMYAKLADKNGMPASK